MDGFERGLVRSLEKRWGRAGVDVAGIARTVWQGHLAGKVVNPNGCLVTACRREAERSGTFTVEMPAVSARAPASYARFRWQLIGAIMRERLAPGQVSERLQGARDAFPAYAEDLAEDAGYLAGAGSWGAVGEAARG